MKEYTRQCPVCNHPVTIKYKGVFKTELVLSEYCGNCGTKFFKTCPSCNKKLEDLTLYCTKCSYKLYDYSQGINNDNVEINSNMSGLECNSANNKVNKSVDIEKIKNQFLNDMFLIQQYYNEIYRLSIKTNDYCMALIEFKENIDSLNENQSNETRVNIFETAINSVNLDDLVNLLNELVSGINDYLQFYTNLIIKALDFPATGYLCRYVNVPDAEKLSEAYALKLKALYGKYYDIFEEIFLHETLLVEYLPRYKKIMTRKGFSDFAVGFFSGYVFGKNIGNLVYKAWDNLRNLSDREFISSFYDCVCDYMNISFNINQSLLNDCEQVLKEVTEEFSNMYIAIADSFKYAELNGVDILQSCREILNVYRYENLGFTINDDTRRMAGHALDELRQYGITVPQENRIIKLLNIDPIR